jgi:hypothetical protein
MLRHVRRPLVDGKYPVGQRLRLEQRLKCRTACQTKVPQPHIPQKWQEADELELIAESAFRPDEQRLAGEGFASPQR